MMSTLNSVSRYREESDPLIMLTSVSATATTMGGIVWWNAAAHSMPALRTELRLGAVAVAAFAADSFIVFQRSSPYASLRGALRFRKANAARLTSIVVAKPKTARRPTRLDAMSRRRAVNLKR